MFNWLKRNVSISSNLSTLTRGRVSSIEPLKEKFNPIDYNSMNYLFQGEPWIEWILNKKIHISLYLRMHRDQPEIQTHQERLSHGFARSLFYGHGLLLHNYDTIYEINVDEWIQGKLNPWKNNKPSEWIIEINNMMYIDPKKSGKNRIKFKQNLTNNDMVNHLMEYVPLLNTQSQPKNYTIEPWLNVWIPDRTIPWYSNVEYNPNVKHYCIVDCGTSKVPAPVQPELVTLKDVAYILFDENGYIIAQQSAKLSINHPYSSFLFFIQWMTLLKQFNAEIISYNGGFDAVVLSRWPYNPCVKQMLNLWNHDLMYMVQQYLKSPKACSLSHAYKTILKKDFDKKWHISINDCLGSKELFLYIINQK